MKRLASGLAVVALACAAACSEAAEPTPVASSPTPRPAATTPGPGAQALRCDSPIGAEKTPPDGETTVFDTVGLALATTLQASDAGGTAPHKLFAKTGLLVHAGRAAILRVPPPWQSRVQIAWGNHAAQWTGVLEIPACPPAPGGGGPWLAYPGGYSVDFPACIPLEVESDGSRFTVQVPVGEAC